ncbi:MAG TPA: pyridoxamine 5'-phosphate oxidase family protein [Syntrophobacteria bacterium]|nr:pyridoxamine 5'-phosphate oxidase family protein [Syntrophobacteria bacterium]
MLRMRFAPQTNLPLRCAGDGMRRSEREIQDLGEIEGIIRKALVCRLGLAANNRPYVVPLCFGYRDRTLYVHSATEGRKVEMVRENPHVCVEFDVDQEVLPAREPCSWSMRYRSAIAFGTASVVERPAEKRRALDLIMEHYGGGASSGYPDRMVENILIIKIEIEQMTGKQANY